MVSPADLSRLAKMQSQGLSPDEILDHLFREQYTQSETESTQLHKTMQERLEQVQSILEALFGELGPADCSERVKAARVELDSLKEQHKGITETHAAMLRTLHTQRRDNTEVMQELQQKMHLLAQKHPSALSQFTTGLNNRSGPSISNEMTKGRLPPFHPLR